MRLANFLRTVIAVTLTLNFIAVIVSALQLKASGTLTTDIGIFLIFSGSMSVLIIIFLLDKIK